MDKVIIASIRYPNGLTWLLNALLELNICVFRGTAVDDVWEIDKSGSYRIRNEHDSLIPVLPAIHVGKEFRFDPTVCVAFTHEFPSEEDLGNRVIIFKRDPRDALYSQYRRRFDVSSRHLGYLEFLDASDQKTCVTPVSNWALFYWAWEKAPNHLGLALEDREDKALSVLQEVCNMLNVSRSETELEAALRASDNPNNSQPKATSANQSTALEYAHFRSGKHFEWETNPESSRGAQEISQFLSLGSASRDYPKRIDAKMLKELGPFMSHRSGAKSSFVGRALRQQFGKRAEISSEDIRRLKSLIAHLSSYRPEGIQEYLDIYMCGIRCGLRGRNSSLLRISLRSMFSEMRCAIARRLGSSSSFSKENFS